MRIEDTDRERSTSEAVTQLLAELSWLGLDFDDTPLYQSSRLAEHVEHSKSLVDCGHAYPYKKGEGGEVVLFRIPWNADSFPNIRDCQSASIALHPDVPVRINANGLSYAQVSKKGKPMPTESCLAGFRELEIYDTDRAKIFSLEPVVDEILAGGQTVSLENVSEMTFLRREVYFNDLIKGELSKPLDSMKDLVIVRSDGTPVFHLANVVDDCHQNITHIIRGDDHIENTYRHVLLFQALGAAPPTYAHLPMIINAQGKPYSKRDGDAYLGEFRDNGYLADAVLNYLTLLGWSPGEDLEKMNRGELIERFTLDRVQSSPAQMDINKLQHMNGLYIPELGEADFIQEVRAVVKNEPWGKDVDSNYFSAVARLMQSRTKLYSQAKEWGYFFEEDISFDEKFVRKHLQKPGIAEALLEIGESLRSTPFELPSIEQAIHDVTDKRDIKQGKLNMPLRIALTGVPTGAGIYEIILLLGEETVLRRLNHAITVLCTSG